MKEKYDQIWNEINLSKFNEVKYNTEGINFKVM